jgi:hypothetical protein
MKLSIKVTILCFLCACAFDFSLNLPSAFVCNSHELNEGILTQVKVERKFVWTGIGDAAVPAVDCL